MPPLLRPESMAERERVVALIPLSREKITPLAAINDKPISFWSLMCDKKLSKLCQDSNNSMESASSYGIMDYIYMWHLSFWHWPLLRCAAEHVKWG